MHRVLLLLPSTTYQAHDFVEAARALRVGVVVGTNDAQVFGDQTRTSLKLDFRDGASAARTVAAFARQTPLDAVIATDDESSVLAAFISRELGLPHNSVESAEAARNKFARRTILKEAGLASPEFQRIGIDEAPVNRIGYPCVLKPTDLAASRGVIRADTPAEFEEAFRRIATMLRDPEVRTEGVVLVESYLRGGEVALEGLLTEGKLRVLALFDKPDPMEGPFFAETIYTTPSRLPPATQEEIVTATAKASEALGLVHGPIHAELRVHDGRAWILEVAPRCIGGRCSRALRFGTGISLEELILRHAVGQEVSGLERERRAAGVMMIPVPQRGVLKAVRRKGAQTEITIPLGQELVPLPDGNKYLGFIFAWGDDPAAVERSLRSEFAELDLAIDHLPG